MPATIKSLKQLTAFVGKYTEADWKMLREVIIDTLELNCTSKLQRQL